MGSGMLETAAIQEGRGHMPEESIEGMTQEVQMCTSKLAFPFLPSAPTTEILFISAQFVQAVAGRR